MTHRKKLIEEIMASFHAMKNKMHGKIMQSGGRRDCITHAQIFVLDLIERHRNIGIKELAQKLGVSSSAATQLVDGLVENRYVSRTRDRAGDRRALHLNLSVAGRRQMITIKNKYREAAAALFDPLTDEELETYGALHKKIASHIL